MADRDTQKELADARTAALETRKVPKHEDLTLPYIPNPTPPTGKELKTRIIVISFKADGSGRFEIKRLDDEAGDMKDNEIFSKLGNLAALPVNSLALVGTKPTMIDMAFKNPTKIVFYLNIANWVFTEVTNNDPKTFPFFIKAYENDQRDQRSFEEFRGLKNLADTTGTIENLKTIVVYNQLKHTIPARNYFSHKFGLRMNYNDVDSAGNIVVTPFEIDPEIKNNG